MQPSFKYIQYTHSAHRRARMYCRHVIWMYYVFMWSYITRKLGKERRPIRGIAYKQRRLHCSMAIAASCAILYIYSCFLRSIPNNHFGSPQFVWFDRRRIYAADNILCMHVRPLLLFLFCVCVFVWPENMFKINRKLTVISSSFHIQYECWFWTIMLGSDTKETDSFSQQCDSFSHRRWVF